MDRETVRLAIDGDRGAFSQLMRESAPRQYAIAVLILHDASAAEDAVQEAFIAAWQGLRALRDADAWAAWLHRLTVRACFRVVKRERRRRQVELNVVPRPEPASQDDITRATAERDELVGALNQLPIEQRAVVVLRYYLDLPLDRVADILGVPLGTAKSRQHRALGALRHSMAEPPAADHIRIMERAS
jgi:RNA polymerase sigma-70 factor (ECF subfamily)